MIVNYKGYMINSKFIEDVAILLELRKKLQPDKKYTACEISEMLGGKSKTPIIAGKRRTTNEIALALSNGVLCGITLNTGNKSYIFR